MVEILIARSAGFCFGVRRAVRLAEELVEDGNSPCVYTSGPIIHNPQEVERLKRKGVLPLEGFEVKEGDTVVIRSHGIPPQEERYLRSKGARIVDATCPYVKAVHRAVVQLVREGYFVVIVGDRDHPEVRGTLGYLRECGGEGMVVESVEDTRRVMGKERVGVVSQTTQDEGFFKEVVGEIALLAKEVKVLNTICKATSLRQEEVQRLAPEVDVMIVVGGKNSGNTRRLYNISKSLNPRTYHVEIPEELRPNWFKNARRVGITAGASTPDWIIESVKVRIEEICEELCSRS